MTIPAATVRVQIQRIKAIPATTLQAGHTRYARCEIQVGSDYTIRSGRTKPIPAAGGDVDISAEAIPWDFELRVDPGTAVGVVVEICEDRGDAPPPTPLAMSFGIQPPWASGTRTAGGGPSVDYVVTTTLITSTDAAFLARAAKPTGVSGTVTVPQSYVVEIGEVAGLYKPRAVVVGNVGATRELGYLSQDNLGRIYTNRAPNGSWSKGAQYIDVLLRVNAIGGATIPAGARIKWTIEDPDDPTNDALEFHRDWGPYVDPNDYSGTTPTGAHRDDNTLAYSSGNANANALFGPPASASLSARWAATMGGPVPAAASGTQAETAITLNTPKLGTSSVRIHCPNVLGTNLVVRAQLTGTPVGVPVHNAATGVMTMWSRIDVEVAKMAGALSVAGVLKDVATCFHPVCVQLDFQRERVISGLLDKEHMTPDDAKKDEATATWVNNLSVFTKQTTPGWFFLGAARLPSPLLAAPPPPLYTGTTYTLSTSGTDVILDIPAAATNAAAVEFEWTAGSTTVKANFPVIRAAVGGLGTQMVLQGNDVVPDFTGHDSDGSEDHAYRSYLLFFPQHEQASGARTLTPGGFGVPAAGAKVKVVPRGTTGTMGISPTVKLKPTDKTEYFAGRTVVFTLFPRISSPGPPPTPKPNFNAEVITTVVHEFLHAFGMPHKCGQWDWRTPREKSCCMNYWNTWLLNASNKPVAGTAYKMGFDMCGRHLMEVRRVHLERNKGLKW